MLVFGMILLGLSSMGLAQGEWAMALLIFLIGLALTWVSGTILLHTTASYLPGRRQEATEPHTGDDAQGEVTTCLDSGKSFPADINACPACGWSFVGDEP